MTGAENISSLALAIGGMIIGILGLLGHDIVAEIPWISPPFGISIHTDYLGSFFTLLISIVAGCVAIFNFGYTKRGQLSRTSRAVFPIFIATLEVIPMANSVPTFLLFWELMALESLVLVLDHHQHKSAQRAALHYAILTQLGFFAILGFFVLVLSQSHGLGYGAAHGATHGLGFDALRGAAEHLSIESRDFAFVLALVGFGSKAGLVPLHAWLPKAHPEAPAPASALMSTAMVTLGIYGLVRFVIVFFHGAPVWWALTLLGIGALSSVYGVIQSSSANDLKVLLAYSTTENMGLIVMALGTELLMASDHHNSLATDAALAMFFLVGSHALFKALGFLATGVISLETGTTDLNKLGGLTKVLPITSMAFVIWGVAASGLPMGSAFIGEWILLQSLIHLGPTVGVGALAAPLAMGAIALTTGVGLLTVVKAVGMGILGKSKSASASLSNERFGTMQAGLVLLAAITLALGLLPGLIVFVGSHAVNAVIGHSSGVVANASAEQIGLYHLIGNLFPIASLLILAVIAGFSYLAIKLSDHKRPKTSKVDRWTCGARNLSSAMPYNASSFAEPLERVFSDVLRPRRDVAIETFEASRLIIARVELRKAVHDSIESALYPPVLALVDSSARIMRAIHNGSLNRYLAIGALGLVIVLVVVH